ncbi:MAG: tetratricopeptide repeat protein [Lyngbya sp. HA4199-MV5]|nr:tetratricopeptide repeat protein [Lyngbya sp. HA4199-MV5]
MLVVLTLFPILTVLGFWLLRRSVLSELLAEITKSGEEIKRETVEQISAAKQEIEEVTSETKKQLEGMVLEAKQVLKALKEQTAIAQVELNSLSTETKSKFDKAALDLQRVQERVTQLSQQLPTLFPASIKEPVAADNLPRVQAITTELETLQAANPKLTLTPDDYFNQGKALFYEARYKEALAAYDKALELDPDYYEVWNHRGVALGNLQLYTAAIAAFDKALELKPDYYEVWNNRGVALGSLQLYTAAIAAFDKALELKPEYQEAWSNRGIALEFLQQYAAAIASHDKALVLKLGLDGASYSKACSCGSQGEVELAVKHLREAINLNADYREKAKTDSDFDAIREDERFRQLLEE